MSYCQKLLFLPSIIYPCEKYRDRETLYMGEENTRIVIIFEDYKEKKN
jgi:hypothetical protein